MLRNNSEIEQLINDDKLTEALEMLKPTFKSDSVGNATFKLLDQIVSRAVAKGDLTLAVNAATYRNGWFGHIEVSKAASWDAIIHKANEQGEFPKIEIPTQFLQPESYGSTPSQLNDLAGEIWTYFRDHHWKIPGYEVIFDAYGRIPESKDAILVRKVQEIRGKDFIIGFHGIQGSVDWNLNNTAGFNYIAVPNFMMEFYSDNSGPAIFEYSGDKWQENIAKMNCYSYMSNEPDWKQVKCSIPQHNQVFLEDLFESKENIKASNSARRQSGQLTKQEFVGKAVSFLEKNVMPKIKGVSVKIEEIDLEGLAAFIEKPSQDCKDEKELQNEMNRVNTWLIERPSAVINIIKSHPFIPATFLLDDLADKMNKQGCLKKLEFLYDTCSDELINACVHNLHDLERCLNAFPAYADKIMKKIFSQEDLVKKIIKNDKNSGGFLQEVSKNNPIYKDEFLKLYMSYFSLLVKENNLAEMKDMTERFKDENRGFLNFEARQVMAVGVRDAILANKMEIARYLLLEEGLHADHKVTLSDEPRSEKKPLIYFAVKSNNLPMVKLLVECHATITSSKSRKSGNDDNNSGIETALQIGATDIAEYLLENGATANGLIALGHPTFEWNKYNIKETYLGIAASNLDYAMTDVFVKYNADVENALYCHNEHLRGRKHKKSLNESKLESYRQSTQLLLDYAMGVNLHAEKTLSKDFDNLAFLNGVNVAGFNFIGLSLDGQPITEEILKSKNIVGYEKAIFTLQDLDNLEKIQDPKRQSLIKRNLNTAFEKQGKLIDEKTGIVNLVPLGEAVKRGDIAAVKARLQAGISPNITYNFLHENEMFSSTPKETSLINIAVFYGYWDMMRLLVEHPEFDQRYLPQAVTLARQLGRHEMALYLLEHQDINQQNHVGNTYLHFAASDGDVTRVKECIEKKADLNITNKEMETALDIAAVKTKDLDYSIDVIRLLLEAKADANIGENDTALNIAARTGSLAAIKLLIPVTIKKDFKYEIFDGDLQLIEKAFPWYVPLMFDSFESKDWLDILTLLVKEGADLNHANENGISLLRLLISNIDLNKGVETLSLHLKQLQFLLDHGANPLEKDENEQTAIAIQQALKLAIEKSEKVKEQKESQKKEKSEKVHSINDSRDAFYSPKKQKPEIPTVDDNKDKTQQCSVM